MPKEDFTYEDLRRLCDVLYGPHKAPWATLARETGICRTTIWRWFKTDKVPLQFRAPLVKALKKRAKECNRMVAELEGRADDRPPLA